MGMQKMICILSQINSCRGLNLREMCELLNGYIRIISSINSSTHFFGYIIDFFWLKMLIYVVSAREEIIFVYLLFSHENVANRCLLF